MSMGLPGFAAAEKSVAQSARCANPAEAHESVELLVDNAVPDSVQYVNARTEVSFQRLPPARSRQGIEIPQSGL
jgi:hypothetical protein